MSMRESLGESTSYATQSNGWGRIMNPVEELKLLCFYVVTVASADLSDQLKYELIFNDRVAEKIYCQVSIDEIYGVEDKDWESHAEEVAEFAVVVEKLLNDLEEIDV